jgi:glycosyltransferase involved in cell wall biosynthesis
MKISLIITTKNENRTISKLLHAIANQTRIPDEVIIATSDRTENYPSRSLGMTKVRFVELASTDNRAVGRNRAIQEAVYDYILITDAGCVPKEDWVEKMSEAFKQADVVAGFYVGESKNIFEKCQIPYVLVMPDKLDPKNFLPATRSMGITKNLFLKLGGFNENYRYAEDYAFARRIQSENIPIAVVSDAIVGWRPRQTLSSFARMIFEHAYGDAYAGNWRPKVGLIFARYFLWMDCLVVWSIQHLAWFSALGLFLFGLYLLYAILKNYRYVRHWKAVVYLPLLQIVSDFAVMVGTIRGLR